MAGFPSPFGGDSDAGGLFDDYEELVPENVPKPESFPFRAWNGFSDCHECDPVRVHAAPIRHQSEAINDQLEEIDETYLEPSSVSRDRRRISTPIRRSALCEVTDRVAATQMRRSDVLPRT